MLLQKTASKRLFADDLKTVFTPSSNAESGIFFFLWLIGGFYFLLCAGALFGFRQAYNKLRSKYGDELGPPALNAQPWVVYISMIVWAVVFGLLPVFFLMFYRSLLGLFFGRDANYLPNAFVLGAMFTNLVVTFFAMASFRRWRDKEQLYFNEATRHGTARFAYDSELEPYKFSPGKSAASRFGGLRIGNDLFYFGAGHALTSAGTRGGKGVNLLIPALLKTNPYKGSWVVVDPKGELAAVTAGAQKRMGRKVVFLNPWELLGMASSPFNPLDILKHDRLNLADDVQLIAESIVPTSAGGDADHFNNRARSIISGLLLHLVTAKSIPDTDRHLATLWQWLRLPVADWDALLVAMIDNDDPNGGDIVQAAGNEIASLMQNGEKEFASTMSTAQRWTDFLKSPALRSSVATSKDFHPADLTDGNTTVYLIIPADRLKTHFQWLRLVVSTLMRSVIRKPNNDVCFLLDEFYALGYLSEIEVALGSYAGYGVHIWAVLQNLVQLKDQYGDNFENFISSCSVRHFFNVSDNFTADYVSKMFGTLSVPSYDAMGNIAGSSGRMLVNPDELRRQSGDVIYAVIDSLHPAIVPKNPYYKMQDLKEGVDYDPNPYQRR